jgi:hypothetical protein
VPDVEDSLRAVAAEVGEVPALVGSVEANSGGSGRPFYNAAAFCHRGKVALVARKCLLPTYDVFDEDRYFEPASQPTVVVHGGIRIGVTICEDIWTHPMINTRRLYSGLDPVKQLAAMKCDLMVNLSASPWDHGKGGVQADPGHGRRPRPRLPGGLCERGRRQRRADLRRPLARQRFGRPHPYGHVRVRRGADRGGDRTVLGIARGYPRRLSSPRWRTSTAP